MWLSLLAYMVLIGASQTLFRVQDIVDKNSSVDNATRVFFVVAGTVAVQLPYAARQLHTIVSLRHDQRMSKRMAVVGFLSGALLVTGTTLYLAMTSAGGQASVLSPLAALYVLFPFVYGVFGFGDRVNIPRGTGVLLAVFSTVCFTMSAGGSFELKGETLLFFFACVTVWGLSTICSQVFALRPARDFALGYLFSIFASALGATVISFILSDGAGPSTRITTSHYILLGGGMCRGIGNIVFYVLARAMPEEAAVVSPLSSLYVLIPVILGMTALGEDAHPWKLTGIAAAIIGVLLMGVRDWSTFLPCMAGKRKHAKHAVAELHAVVHHRADGHDFLIVPAVLPTTPPPLSSTATTALDTAADVALLEPQHHHNHSHPVAAWQVMDVTDSSEKAPTTADLLRHLRAPS